MDTKNLKRKKADEINELKKQHSNSNERRNSDSRGE